MASRMLSKRITGSVAPRLRQVRSVANAAAAAAQNEQPRRSRPLAVAPFGLFDESIPAILCDIWEPASSNRSMRHMMDVMDKYMDAPGAASFADRTLKSGVRTPWDVLEKQEGFYLRVDMPGLDKHEVKINVEDDDLVIRGEHKVEEGKDDVFSSPRSYNTRMVLPKEVQRDQITAELKNGVLTVFVPKMKPADKKVTQITVS